MSNDEIIRQLEALQDEQEAEIISRLDAIGQFDEVYEPARLLGIAIGLADGYRKAGDLLRGGPRPGGVTFRIGEIHRSQLGGFELDRGRRRPA